MPCLPEPPRDLYQVSLLLFPLQNLIHPRHTLGPLNAASSCSAWSECTPKPLMIPVNFPRLLGIRYDIKHAEPGLPAPEHVAAELRGATLANGQPQFRSYNS